MPYGDVKSFYFLFFMDNQHIDEVFVCTCLNKLNITQTSDEMNLLVGYCEEHFCHDPSALEDEIVLKRFSYKNGYTMCEKRRRVVFFCTFRSCISYLGKICNKDYHGDKRPFLNHLKAHLRDKNLQGTVEFKACISSRSAMNITLMSLRTTFLVKKHLQVDEYIFLNS